MATGTGVVMVPAGGPGCSPDDDPAPAPGPAVPAAGRPRDLRRYRPALTRAGCAAARPEGADPARRAGTRVAARQRPAGRAQPFLPLRCGSGRSSSPATTTRSSPAQRPPACGAHPRARPYALPRRPPRAGRPAGAPLR
ncbi:hypothetical protein HBB16_03800 [Pseudonocardia sp. MCCB 268]|nr:hypothetical protein [Pseudonocardia cytotoxica]